MRARVAFRDPDDTFSVPERFIALLMRVDEIGKAPFRPERVVMPDDLVKVH